jgi:hypothetical protein
MMEPRIVFCGPEKVGGCSVCTAETPTTHTWRSISFHLMVPMVSQVQDESHPSNITVRIASGKLASIVDLFAMWLTFGHASLFAFMIKYEMDRCILHVPIVVCVATPPARHSFATRERSCKEILPPAPRDVDVFGDPLGQLRDLIGRQWLRLPEVLVWLNWLKCMLGRRRLRRIQDARVARCARRKRT